MSIFDIAFSAKLIRKSSLILFVSAKIDLPTTDRKLMSETTSLIESKKWYHFAQALYNIYPSHSREFTDISLFLDEPKIRYIVAARGTASDCSLIALLDEYILSNNRDEDLKASIVKLLSNSEISEDVETHFINTAPTDIVLALIENPKIVTRHYKSLLDKKSHIINNHISKILGPESKLFESLEKSKDPNILEGLLQNPYIDEDIILTILSQFRHELPSMRAAARNPNLPYSLMSEWSRSQDPTLQRTLALNSNLNLETQEILSCSADERTIVNLASNPSLDNEIAERFLSSLYSDSVRLAMAANPKLNADIVKKLLASQNDYVRAEIICNQQHISSDLIAQIAIDETEQSVIKQIVLKSQLSDSIWKILYNRTKNKSNSAYFFYMRKLNDYQINIMRSEASSEYKYLLMLQPNYDIRKKHIASEDLITSFSRLIKYHISNGTLSDAFVLDEAKALISDRR